MIFNMKELIIILAFVFGAMHLSLGQSALGKWKTIDDETGDLKSIVEIYKKGDELYGKVIELFRKPNEDPDPICDECDDDRKGKKVLGMEIIRGLEQDDDVWEDGTIVDPANGKVYDCKIWVDEDDPDKLNVRGYILMFYRTQNWIRVQ